MNNNAKVGGILSIVSGGIGIVSVFAMVLWAVFALAVGAHRGYWGEGWMDAGIAVFLIILGFCRGLLSILAIVGGVFGIRKRLWGLALAGSIASFLTFWPCGIPAVIFTTLGKSEFNTQAQAPSPPPAPLEKIVG